MGLALLYSSRGGWERGCETAFRPHPTPGGLPVWQLRTPSFRGYDYVYREPLYL